MTGDEQAAAYYFVAGWHTRQAALFCDMAKDEPRIDGATRTRAAEAARHHAGSAAALKLAATNLRRLAVPVPPQTKTEQER